MKPRDKKYILDSAGKRSPAQIAKDLRIKERKVREVLESNKAVLEAIPRSAEIPVSFPDKRIPGILAFAIILFIGMVIYANSFHNEFIYDDISNIVNNPAIKSFSNIPNIFTQHLGAGGGSFGKFYRPVLDLVVMVNYHFGGLNPFIYHVTNTVFHVIVCALLFCAVRCAIKNDVLALIISVLYLVHPVHTQAITYIAGKADPIAATFLLLMIIFQYKYWSAAGFKKTLYYIMILLFFILALLTKELAVSFPLLLLLVECCFRDKEKYSSVFNKKAVFYLPFFILIAVWLVLKNRIVSPVTMIMDVPTIYMRLLTASRAIAEYIRLSFFPAGLHIEYRFPRPNSVFQPGYFGPVLFTLALLAAIFLLRQKGRKDGSYRIMFFGLSWFLLALFPYLNIVFLLNAPLAEHWLYIPEMGLILFIVYSFFYYLKNKALQPYLIALFVIFAIAYSALTVKQNLVWKDGLTFYTYNLKYSSYSPALYNNLAAEYINKKDYITARRMLKNALKLEPGRSGSLNNILNNIKTVDANLGKEE